MQRPNIHKQLMRVALIFAEQSTCVRVKAGSVIVVDNRIVSTGYNGNAPGKEHCYDHFKKLWMELDDIYKVKQFPKFEDYIKNPIFNEIHHNWSIIHELHAEMNSIIYCAKKGISIEGATIYTTYSPCLFCGKAIINAGIKHVYFHTLYDRKEGHESIETLKENNIIIEQINV